MINNLNINKYNYQSTEINKENHITGIPSLDRPWLKYYSKEAIDAKVSDKSIYEFMKDSNSKRLNYIALKYFHNNITYKELLNRIDKTAIAFQNIGIKQNDIVTLSLPNIPENIICLYALNKIGAIANMIDLRLKGDKLIDAINSVDSSTIVVTDLFAQNLDQVYDKTNLKRVIMASPSDSLPPLVKLAYKIKNKKLNVEKYVYINWKDFEESGKNGIAKKVESKPDDSVVIMHTSGTTGKAKGVVLTNYNFNAIVEEYRHSGLQFAAGDKFLSEIPPFLAFSAFVATHLPLSFGMCIDLLPNYEPEKYVSNLIKYKPNHSIAGPADWMNLIDNKKLKNQKLDYLKTLASGGDKISLEKQKIINEILKSKGCKSKIIEGYGMTEVSSAAVTNLNHHNVVGSAGIPLPKMNVCIYDNENDKELGYEEKGEICFSGPTVMKEYYNNLEETKKVLKTHKDGNVWLHSGDIGYINKDGNIFLDGRSKRIIVNYQGFKISPFEIENIIKTIDEVDNVCVVGIDDPNHSQGQIPVANILLKKDVVEDDNELITKISNKCNCELTGIYIPEHYEIVDAIPLTSVGKIDYRKLQEENSKKYKSKSLKK